MIQIRSVLFFALFALSTTVFSQTTYPKITGYFSVMHPITTFSEEGTTVNFRDYYSVNFPTGINIWKSPKIGFSFEIAPNIRTENGISKVSSVLFHPGVLVALGDGYTFAGRAAFETSGRFGVTPVISKTVIKNTNSSYYVSIPLPLRFGNDHPTTFTVGLQFGIAF
ncbi:hypothetical protein [Flavobacterium sp. B183]|uniref:hypothetical protein n=1 Tax=Flavobacterium sp. B183 TaxID=907046 RepID=UPI00201F82E2|nr:hypothetical protein [Flavobacterium sp. B183]URC11691.1 hypothetical protein M4I44_16510 [Flavobacterium sp. B183]